MESPQHSIRRGRLAPELARLRLSRSRPADSSTGLATVGGKQLALTDAHFSSTQEDGKSRGTGRRSRFGLLSHRPCRGRFPGRCLLWVTAARSGTRACQLVTIFLPYGNTCVPVR